MKHVHIQINWEERHESVFLTSHFSFRTVFCRAAMIIRPPTIWKLIKCFSNFCWLQLHKFKICFFSLSVIKVNEESLGLGLWIIVMSIFKSCYWLYNGFIIKNNGQFNASCNLSHLLLLADTTRRYGRQETITFVDKCVFHLGRIPCLSMRLSSQCFPETAVL